MAPVSTMRPRRPVRGRRGHLSDPGLRPVEHDPHRGRARGRGRRPARVPGVRRRRTRPLPCPSGRAARDRGAVHPLPHRPLRRHTRRDGPRRRHSDRRPRGLHGALRRRERLRRHRDAAPRRLPHRRRAGTRPARPDRRRPRLHRLPGTAQPPAAHPADHPYRAGGTLRRRPVPLPAHAGHRSPLRAQLPPARTPRPVHGRERHPQPSQHPDPARRPGPRRPDLVPLPHRGHRSVRRRLRCPVRLPPLAHLGHRTPHDLPLRTARPLRLPPRPDPAPAQPGPHRHRDRRDDRAAAPPRGRLAHPRLLRLGQPQRQSDLPAVHGLVRRPPLLSGSTRPPLPPGAMSTAWAVSAPS